MSQNILNFYPRPNVGRNLFTSTEVLENNTNQFGGRIDHRLSASDEIFVRYLFSQAEVFNPLSINGADVPGFPVSDDIRSQNPMVSNTHTFGNWRCVYSTPLRSDCECRRQPENLARRRH